MRHLDKLLHFLACFAATFVSPWLAVGLAIGKEYGDSRAIGNKWDWMDMLVNATGIALAMTIKTIFHF